MEEPWTPSADSKLYSNFWCSEPPRGSRFNYSGTILRRGKLEGKKRFGGFFFLERGRGVESVSPSSQMIRTKPSYPRAALNDQKVENTTNKVMCPGRAFSFRERSTTIFVLDLSFVKGCENLSCISRWFTCSPWSPSVLRRQVGFHDARTSGQGGWSLLLP